jgi:hypothetical protein
MSGLPAPEMINRAADALGKLHGGYWRGSE